MEKIKKKSLGFLEVFSIASGAMISSGLFVLPAVVFAKAGSAVVSAYVLAGIMMIPPLLAKAELSTAMPKSGGTYFYVERSLGPLLGAFAGFAGWFSIALKGAFALVGIGAFWSLIDPGADALTFKMIALAFVVVFTLINLLGAHSSARSQVVMVILLLIILLGYVVFGSRHVADLEVREFFPREFGGLFQVAGMVFVAYGGLTKVAALAHEVREPGKTLPRGMLVSFLVVNTLYVAAVIVTLGVLDEGVFRDTLTPLSSAASSFAGRVGSIILALAALLAFGTTANASILSASQNPAAMARDALLPEWIGRSNKRGVPTVAILITAVFMAVVILVLDIPNLVKSASTMMLILFLLDNLSVILMRESRIVSYRPQFKVPLYPFLPVVGILLSGALIFAMGTLTLVLAGAFFSFTTIWTLIYKPHRGRGDSALFRIVERMAAREVRGARLSEELGQILRERDGVDEDRFDRLVRKAIILDFPGTIDREKLFAKLAGAFTLRLSTSYDRILQKLHDRETESTTQLSDDLAIPHIVLEDEDGFEIVVVRAKNGIDYDEGRGNPKIVFALAGAAAERNFHLQCLMAIAQITQSPEFTERWNDAFDEEELRLLVLLAERNR